MNRYSSLAFLLVGAAALTAQAAEMSLEVTGRYLIIPVSHKADRVPLTLSLPGQEEMPVKVRIPQDGTPEYYTFKDMSAYRGKKIKLTFPDNLKGTEMIGFADEIPDGESIYKERNRPQFHFTTRRGWINDPNGLVFYDGEYHLFYQHNPFERDWENMTWGHAVSPDLLHWTELPTALHPDRSGTMFSGSAVVDYDNCSGFGREGNPAMVAFYTIDNDHETQGMAYSLDHGRTFVKYEGNPVIDSYDKWQTHDTRDPKVFRYRDRWVMVLNERDGHSIYNSSNLRDWEYKSHITGFWECPELFELPVDGDDSNRLWVMYGASGTYMLGNFDGERFKPVSGKHRNTGGSIYAAQTYNNIPESDGRRIQIGWGRLSHPGENFNGMMLLPTELSLTNTLSGVRLVSKPVREVDGLCKLLGKWSNLTQEEANEALRKYSAYDLLRVRFTLLLSHATDASLSLDDQRLFDYDMNHNTLNGFHYSPADPTSMEITADIFIDRTSVEAFIDGGLFSYSFGRKTDNSPVLASTDSDSRSAGTVEWNGKPFEFRGNRLTVKSLELFDVASIWP